MVTSNAREWLTNRFNFYLSVVFIVSAAFSGDDENTNDFRVFLTLDWIRAAAWSASP
jgi:hypothetical protein